LGALRAVRALRIGYGEEAAAQLLELNGAAIPPAADDAGARAGEGGS
jgi:hypothetical protein